MLDTKIPDHHGSPASPMEAALMLAAEAVGVSEPNPRVGCVITSADGTRWLGQGQTQAAGSAHAEVMALRDAAAKGHNLAGATAYVTLEPCSHHGRTPPCCDALIAAGVSRVVIAIGDPNPQVNGQGVARLRAAGITVEWADSALGEASRELNIGFFSRMQRGRPWVRMKLAGSLDGRSALPNGRSQWITGEPARQDGHRWRHRAGAVLTGVGTVLADDPLLDIRFAPKPVPPLRVIVDSQLRTPPQSRLLNDGGAPARLYHLANAASDRAAALRHAGASLVACPAEGDRVSIAAVMADLAALHLNELHVEAGAVLSGALLAEGWVDEVLLYVAPLLVGPGRPLVEMPPRLTLPSQPELEIIETHRIGADLRLRLRPPGRAHF